MLQNLLRPSTIPLLKQFAKFNERRHEVLAANIAKIDTPGYKSRDLPVEAFQQAMKKAAEQQAAPPTPSASPYTSSLFPIRMPTTHQSAQVDPVDSLFTDELFQSQAIPATELSLQDNGKRSIEFEVMEMTRTLMQQNYAIQMMNSQYTLLEAVIAERP
jgi:flagellar basal-body rod protein FlgB